MDSPQQNGTSGFQSLVVKRTKSWLDPLAVFTAVFLTLFFYVYEVFYVMPQLLGNFGQTVHFVVATWLAYNILGNLRICTKTKNSVDTLPSELLKPRKGEEHLWHFCDKCHRTVPPRSWHCKICNVCILKRDHHCNFVGNCVGHNNQRYFIWFSFYATIGSGLALFDNALFAFKHHVEVINIFSVNNLLIREYYSPGASSDFGLQCLLSRRRLQTRLTINQNWLKNEQKHFEEHSEQLPPGQKHESPGPLRNGIVNTFWPIGEGGVSPSAAFVPAIAYCDGHI
ncbi:hypothetical protein M5D96_002589 [Drosophila gunungcola]|uniref:Palmitoyltransferase n=1 Tax=Drosophila gunungcola TaxID=103775 RepID=A0A9Q0BVS5_9MUSC|nr:hypothetical protein M5D96_002589 [Drosophila gunungcola]